MDERSPPTSAQRAQAACERLTLEELAPLRVVVNRQEEIVLVAGETGHFFDAPSPAAGAKVLDAVAPGLRAELEPALRSALASGRPAAWDAPALALDDGVHRVRLTVRPLPHVERSAGLWIIVIEDRGLAAEQRPLDDELDAVNAKLRQTVAELRESEERFRLLVGGVKDLSIFMLAPDGTVMTWNAGAERLKGYRAEEVVGQHFARFFTEDDQRAGLPARNLAEAARTGRFETEGWRVRNDGSRFRASIVLSAIRDPCGKLRGFAKVVRDVTEQRQTEEAAEGQRRLLETVVEHLPLAVCLIRGSDLRLQVANPEYHAISPSKEMVGRTLDEIWPETGRDFATLCRSVLETGTPFHVDDDRLSIVRSPGRPPEEAFFTWSLHRVVLPGGEGFGILNTAWDTTARRQVEAAVRESEQRFRTLANAIPQLAWMADADGWITWYNDRWYEYTGTTPQQMEGWGWQSVHDPSVLPRVLDEWKGSIATGEPFNMVFPLRGADGRFRSFLTRVHPLKDADGKVVQWFGTNTDISERVEFEESLREADRRKDQFLAMLAHELRNPLAPLHNSVHVLERTAPGGEPARRAQGVIARQVAHMTRLVNDLLDVTRISRGKIELHRERVDLGELARRAVEDYLEAFRSAQIGLDVTLPDERVWVRADRTRLVQVLGNLLHNAAKFTPAGGTTRVSVRRDPERAEAVLSVRDSGIGIASELLPRVFEPFAQADTSLDRSKGGLGLGLAMVKGLVELHGGSVRAESAGAGQGTEIAARLPLEDARLPAVEGVEAHAPSEARPRRVLVIEDNVDAAESLRAVLEMWHHAVEVALSGPAGIEIARRFGPDVVVCDIGLPGMDGYEVARAMRGDPALRGARLVALTGYAGPRDVERARDAGFDVHLAKPANHERLQAAVGVGEVG